MSRSLSVNSYSSLPNNWPRELSSHRDESLVKKTAPHKHIVPEGQNFGRPPLSSYFCLTRQWLPALSSQRDESLVKKTAPRKHIVPEGQNFVKQAYWRITGLIALVFFFFTFSSKANDPAYDFQKANELYQKQNYDSAAKIYEQLIAKEYYSAEVYYNLANCYYKLDNVSHAILNYERALKLKPDDEDILFNLKVAQLKVIDKIETVPEIFYVRWAKSISSLLTTDNWSRLVIICIWIMFLFAAMYVLSSAVVMKRIGFLMATIFLLVTIAVFLISRQSYSTQVQQKRAVVMSMSAYVKSSPGDNNTDLFVLHEGTRMDILDSYDNWVKIRIANGSIGWLKSADIEEI
jgi:tetratricopeptide (TPR) repeat protein